MTTLDTGIALAYVLGILAFGFAVSRRIGGFRDWFVAGGRMTTPILVCTLVSTYYGLDVLLGGSEVGYQEGVVGWFWYSRPYYLAILVAAFLLAGRLRRFDFLSLPDIAARSYGRPTHAVVAVASFFYAMPLMALMGIGILLEILFGIPFTWGVVLGAVVSVAYTLMGGLLADALTDTVQFVLMCLTLGIAAALVLEGRGSIEALRANLPAEYFQPMGTYPLGILIVFSLGALSVLVEPALYQRIFAARSRRAVVAAALVPVLGGLFLRRPPCPLAGLLSSITGLATVLLFYLLLHLHGAVDPEWETVIWKVSFGGWRLELWQEYAVLLALPMSALAFVVGEVVGRLREKRTAGHAEDER